MTQSESILVSETVQNSIKFVDRLIEMTDLISKDIEHPDSLEDLLSLVKSLETFSEAVSLLRVRMSSDELEEAIALENDLMDSLKEVLAAWEKKDKQSAAAAMQEHLKINLAEWQVLLQKDFLISDGDETPTTKNQ